MRRVVALALALAAAGCDETSFATTGAPATGGPQIITNEQGCLVERNGGFLIPIVNANGRPICP